MAALAYVLLASIQVIMGAGVLALMMGIPSDVKASLLSVALGLLVCVFSGYLYKIMQALLELLAFWVEAIWGLQVALYFLMNFLSGALIPLSLFPEQMQAVLAWTPFPYLIAFPTNVILGKVAAVEFFRGVTLMVCWGIALTFAASLIWKKGIREYSSVGI